MCSQYLLVPNFLWRFPHLWYSSTWWTRRISQQISRKVSCILWKSSHGQLCSWSLHTFLWIVHLLPFTQHPWDHLLATSLQDISSTPLIRNPPKHLEVFLTAQFFGHIWNPHLLVLQGHYLLMLAWLCLRLSMTSIYLSKSSRTLYELSWPLVHFCFTSWVIQVPSLLSYYHYLS